ncbi:lantibiotic dehydratase C-terminal domain-containing protein [Streptomyces sp. t39]|uniref:lantibiotic dehydratase C-terminal domain-containing protein n=1 Tax=Streptomyces sp. t39 TaxID=1828156 RepID=UPI0011CD64C9|nr:lantibiotic dehydratase C-terminal domain-containing protein [Streptomyces sp. t39]TXS58187.1 hypothetical protein EAO77_00465 [Streptomyces sp. t39]
MTHHWLHARVPAPYGTGHHGISHPQPPETLRELTRDLRAADRSSRWFFHWGETGRNPEIGFWAHSASPELREVENRLRTEILPSGTDSRIAYLPDTEGRPPHHQEACDIEFADDVAMASSELALAVAREAALPDTALLALATWHLRHVVALVPEPGRKGFLFQCWQYWTEGLTPERRTELCERSRHTAPTLADGLPPMSPEVAGAWDEYLRTLRRAAGTWAAEGAPVNYLLFDHAHLTHRRLRIPAVTEALAARTVRAVLGEAGRDTQPIAVPTAALQTV